MADGPSNPEGPPPGGEPPAPKPDKPEDPHGPQFTPEQQKASLAARWMVYLQGVTDPDEREILKIGLPLLISANEQPPEGKPKITDKQRATAHAELARGMRPESEASRKNKSLQELLSREDVQRELAKDNPDFNSNALKGLMEYFAKIDISSERGAELALAAQFAAKLSTDVHQTDGIAVSEISRRVLFEMAYEKLIGKPDYGSEQTRYNIGGFELQALMDEVDGMAVREFDQRLPGESENFVSYLSELKHVRELAHELNRNLNVGEMYKKYMLEELRGEGLDFMQNGISGVSAVVRMYEKAAAARVSDTHTQFVEGDVTIIDGEVRKAIETLHDRGTLTKDGRALTDWERKRALRIGKIFFAGTQRMAMYTGIGDINESLTPASVHLEYIVRALMPFKEVSPRFFSSNPGSKALMELVFKEIREANAEKGTPYIGFFGASEDAILQSACGAKDMESHGWRQQMMFFGNLNIDEQQTLLDYLTTQQGSIPAKKLDGTEWDGGKKGEFSRTVRSDVLGQRLYLSILVRHGEFDSSLKKEIWEKIALLKPSTLASLLPETLRSKRHQELFVQKAEGKKPLTDAEIQELDRHEITLSKTWNELRAKLYIAEEERVEHDAREHDALAGDTEGLRLSREAERAGLQEALGIARLDGPWTPKQWRTVLKYMGMESLVNADSSIRITPAEKRLLQELIKKGVAGSEKLSTAQMPFTFVIDDAPKTAWKKTGHGQAGLAPEDLIRLLTSDQQSYAEGWNEINGLVEFPTKEVIKHIGTAVDKIGTVDGRTSAQDQLEPFIAGWMRMAKTYESNQWIPGMITAEHMLRKPTSIMEEYYRNEFISMDAEERMVFLTAMSQAKAIRDSLAAGDLVGAEKNMTQLDRLRKETGSDRMSLFVYQLRIMIEVFGPGFAMEFLNGIMPKDLKG